MTESDKLNIMNQEEFRSYMSREIHEILVVWDRDSTMNFRCTHLGLTFSVIRILFYTFIRSIAKSKLGIHIST